MKALEAMCVVLACGLFLVGSISAAVPQQISYQGRLTDNGQAVVDATYSVVFSIYSVASSGSPIWTETQNVTTKDGLFTVQLGSVASFPVDLFETSPRYLGIAISGNPEVSPRTQMVSVPFALYAGNLAGGPCAACSTIFVNTRGPDALRAAADTAFSVTDSGSAARVALNTRIESGTTDTVTGILARVTNKSTGQTKGGVFDVRSTTAAAIEGVSAQSWGSNNGGHVRGITGSASNAGTGSAYGGFFAAVDSGSGDHYGLYARSYGVAGAKSVGVYGSSFQDPGGVSEGGSFSAMGGSANYGVRAYGRADDVDSAVGVYGYADGWNGIAYGGYFVTDSNGAGSKIGVRSRATGDDGSAFGFATTASTVDGSIARGLEAYGIQTGTVAASGAYGAYVYGSAHAGPAYGARMVAGADAGEAYGAFGVGFARNHNQRTVGVYGMAADYYVSSTYSGVSYAGCFENNVTVGGTAYGVYSIVDSTESGSSAFGVYGRSEHRGSGSSYGGYFLVDSTGTGYSYGIRPVSLSKGTAPTWGVTAFAANRGSGQVMGGLFEAYNAGTGAKYGVYGKAPTSGYAGYFEGNIRVTGNQTVVGTKSAAVEVAPEEFRLVYSQESPECWFEDFGEGQLVNGQAHIAIDAGFLPTVNTGVKYHVFLTPHDQPIMLAVANRTAASFDVRGPAGSNLSFSYRIVAKRKGYENVRLARMEGDTPAKISAQVEASSIVLRADEAAMEVAHAEQRTRSPRADDETAHERE